VTNSQPIGPGSLADAIFSANANKRANTIEFTGAVWNTQRSISLASVPFILSNTGGTQTIIGPETGVVLIAGGGGVFKVEAGVTASISRMAFTGG
jgi:hypothetical protein